MDQSWSQPSHPDPHFEPPAAGPARQTVDLLVCLCIGVLVFRTFVAEAYVVPTGSMAPTLLGHHREVTCTNCAMLFVVGIDEQGRTGQSLCPNCGQGADDESASIRCSGDRVLVQKFLYEFRRPRRWEVAVFHFPGDPSQAYVKRVVGLPGESIRLRDGDVYADGAIARKSFGDVRAMRIPVHDSRFAPSDSDRYPRWTFRRSDGRRELVSNWSREDEGGFVHRAATGDSRPVDDWLVYRHWEPTRQRYTAIHDFYAYNGAELPSDHSVADVSIEAGITAGPDVESIVLALESGRDRFLIRLPVSSEGPIRMDRNGRRIAVLPRKNARELIRKLARSTVLEASIVDRRVQVALDGELLFEPLDYEDEKIGDRVEFEDSPGRIGENPATPPAVSSVSPVGIGVRGGTLTVAEVKVYRDVYYTSSLAQTPRHAFGVLKPYRLGDDEYFVLGDNSPVSNDSRFWSLSPVVRGSMFLGKPFLVHLPGQVVPLEVFGRSVYWVPDPRKIRYIR